MPRKKKVYEGTLEVYESFHKAEVEIGFGPEDSQPERPFGEMMDIIDHDPRLLLSLDTYIQMILGSGIKIKAKKKEIKTKIEDWFEDIRFDEKLEDGLYSYLGAGNMYFEKAPLLADIEEIPIDTVKAITRTRKGKLKKYILDVNNKKIELDPKDVIQFKFTNARREVFGRGLFHSIINKFTDPDTSEIYQAPIFAMKSVEDDMVKIFKNYASPMMMFHFEDAGENFIKNQADGLKKAKAGSRIVTDKKFDVEVFEANPNAKYDKYIQHLQNDIIEVGAQFPLQLFNAGFTARAASETTDSVIIRKVKRIQKRLAKQIKLDIILPYLKGINKRVKPEDLDVVFEFEAKAELSAQDIQGLFEKGTIRRSEVRKYLAKHTPFEIDQEDMDDTPPITSVTPTNDMGETPEEEIIAKIEALREMVQEKVPNPRGRPKRITTFNEAEDCMDACLSKKKAAGIPINDQAIAICANECGIADEHKKEYLEVFHKKRKRKRKEAMEDVIQKKKLDILDKAEKELDEYK